MVCSIVIRLDFWPNHSFAQPQGAIPPTYIDFPVTDPHAYGNPAATKRNPFQKNKIHCKLAAARLLRRHKPWPASCATIYTAPQAARTAMLLQLFYFLFKMFRYVSSIIISHSRQASPPVGIVHRFRLLI
jgi:hypothetical protein